MPGVDKMLDAVGENKFQKFDRLVVNLGNELVSEGVCKSYTITSNGDYDFAKFGLDVRPLSNSDISDEFHRKIAKRYLDLMYSCGVTDDDLEYTHGGIYWITESKVRN
jgi:hypothetical protein